MRRAWPRVSTLSSSKARAIPESKREAASAWRRSPQRDQRDSVDEAGELRAAVRALARWRSRPAALVHRLLRRHEAAASRLVAAHLPGRGPTRSAVADLVHCVDDAGRPAMLPATGGSSTILAAALTTRSRIVGMPSGRLPPPRLREGRPPTGSGRYVLEARPRAAPPATPYPRRLDLLEGHSVHARRARLTRLLNHRVGGVGSTACWAGAVPVANISPMACLRRSKGCWSDAARLAARGTPLPTACVG